MMDEIRAATEKTKPMEVSQKSSKEKSCPLCNIPDQEVLVDFPRWRLARTKTMKAHRERLMLYHKDHVKTLDEQSIGEAHMLLLALGQKFFSHAKQWAIFEPVYATVPGHWHRVASDLDPNCDDYEQILKTPRLIIDTDQMTISRVKPEPLERQPEAPTTADHRQTQSPQLPSRLSKPPDAPSVWRQLDQTNEVE